MSHCRPRKVGARRADLATRGVESASSGTVCPSRPADSRGAAKLPTLPMAFRLTTRTCRLNAWRASAALVVALGFTASSHASDVPIFKCMQADGQRLYTDTPCKGGEVLRIPQTAPPDPAALRQLERARDALDISAARRKAKEEFESVRRDESDRLMREEDARQAAYAAMMDTYIGYAPWWGWYPGFAQPRPHRPEPPPVENPKRFAPHPPYVVPRR